MKKYTCPYCSKVTDNLGIRKNCPNCGTLVDQSFIEITEKPVKTTEYAEVNNGKKSKKILGGVFSIGTIVTIISVVINIVNSIKPVKNENIPSPHINTSYSQSDDSDTDLSDRKVYDSNEINKNNGVYSMGTYEIGVDIPEGDYLMMYSGPADSYGDFPMGIYSDPNAENEISFKWGQNSAYVHLEGNGYFHFSWANAYDISKRSVTHSPFQGSGMFLCGVDFEPGTYELESLTDQGYEEWIIYSDIIAVDGIQCASSGYETRENETVTVEEGQYLELSFCKLKK